MTAFSLDFRAEKIRPDRIFCIPQAAGTRKLRFLRFARGKRHRLFRPSRTAFFAALVEYGIGFAECRRFGALKAGKNDELLVVFDAKAHRIEQLCDGTRIQQNRARPPFGRYFGNAFNERFVQGRTFNHAAAVKIRQISGNDYTAAVFCRRADNYRARAPLRL